MVENENADDTFGPDAPKYLAKKLPSKGLLIPNYYATGHFSLDNYISMISGQAPNPQTQLDCQFFSDFTPGIPAADGQVIGSGCVYPKSVETVADQLQAKGLRWRGYMEDMAAKAPSEPVGLPPSGDRVAGRHAGRRGRRSVRDPAQPVHVLPLDHRCGAQLQDPRRRLHEAGQGPEEA